MDTTWYYKTTPGNDHRFYQQRIVLVKSNIPRRTRIRPVWLHLITIFFSRKMFFTGIKLGLAGWIMCQYHVRLGVYLLILAACMDDYV